MRVTVSVHGKFHAFQLASQLERHHVLERIVTSDPRVLLDRRIPRARARTFPLSEAMTRLPARIGLDQPVWSSLKASAHDHWASRVLGNPDLVVAWSGAARRVLDAAHDRGALTILERGSTHIEHQNRVLQEEHARFGGTGGVPPAEIRAEVEEYQRTDFVMVPSRFARQTFLDQGLPEEKLLQVPYGSDVSAFTPGKKKDDVFRILFAGSISLRKGVPYLLRAVRELMLPRSELVFAGKVSPEMEPILSKYDGMYRMAGPLNQGALAELMRQSSVLVLPSIEEGLALVIREALACGLPVIATQNSGAEDAFADGEGGFIVPAREILVLSDRIERLYRDQDLHEEQSRQALANARRWSWNDYGDAILATYSKAMERRAAGPATRRPQG